MEISKLDELLGVREERRGRAFEHGIFALWILMFVFQGWSLQIYYSVVEYTELYYMRKILSAQNQIFTLNVISSVIWFIVTLYILYSALRIERREKYNIASGVLFFVSGLAELIIALILWGYIAELDYINTHLPLLDFDYIQSRLQHISLGLNLYATASNAVVYLCIGLAFIFIGISIKEFANKLISSIQAMATFSGYGISTGSMTMASPAGYEKVSKEGMIGLDIMREIMSGAKSMRSGGNMYIACGVLDLLSIFIQGLATLAFIFFILGVLNAGRGRRIIENVRKRLMSLKVVGVV
ncbi:MAG: hypothetical protein NDP16_03005 [Crenarchaeota archaeon]|nr:hypothetical protein [Thermoproteota archaeon]MCR8463094.1 hypothetical protein [Thermoproteota archaeon]MCR8470758.1 hypothetical protein [Thermoproteota archaeon]MCR8471958.1 hypothetical protein [Thermoproteota archaeon]MCR8473270.1 hypothetical protein [Thermoproteota archaeon]